MYDEYFDENTLEFWEIYLNHGKYPQARGVLYEKPTPSTVKARIHFPRLEPYADELRVNDQTRLSAYCANKRWMRNIAADVKEIRKDPDGGVTMELLLHRKSILPELDEKTVGGILLIAALMIAAIYIISNLG